MDTGIVILLVAIAIVITAMCIKCAVKCKRENFNSEKDDISSVAASQGDVPDLQQGGSAAYVKNNEYWPYQYYSYPYHFAHGGIWPRGMYSRLHYFSPGFYTTTGYSRDLRPGIQYPEWPRARWVRHNGTRYFINNRANGTQMNSSEDTKPIGSILQPYKTEIIGD